MLAILMLAMIASYHRDTRLPNDLPLSLSELGTHLLIADQMPRRYQGNLHTVPTDATKHASIGYSFGIISSCLDLSGNVDALTTIRFVRGKSDFVYKEGFIPLHDTSLQSLQLITFGRANTIHLSHPKTTLPPLSWASSNPLPRLRPSSLLFLLYRLSLRNGARLSGSIRRYKSHLSCLVPLPWPKPTPSMAKQYPLSSPPLPRTMMVL